MGNCCTVGSSGEWAGDDWGSLTSKHNDKSKNSRRNYKVFDEEEEEEEAYHDQGLMKQRPLGAVRAASNYNDHGNNSNNDGKVVKIMISKKELKQLLGASSDSSSQKNMKHASPEQVLARLMYARDHNHHHRYWRPVLQSIPEVN